MIEPRFSTVILLDGTELDFLITPELLTCDLAEMVASHLTLTDKEYFGLSYIDLTGNRYWLQSERKVLDHELPKKNGVLILYYSVKFYIENIAFTRDKVAVEYFYYQARLLVYQGELEINSELIFELGALVLQSIFGDYKNDRESIKGIKSQNILPKRFYNSMNQLNLYEQKVISYYKKCCNMTRGQCIVNYLSIIEKLSNYGVHYYEVKDKSNIKWNLGVSYRGIGLYEQNNRTIAKKIFPWSKLENLYYRDRKFSIEVHESQNFNSSNLIDSSPKIDPNNIILKPSTAPSADQQDTFNPVKVYAWFASIPVLCKSIWLMAVAQHQFYLDKKQNRDNMSQFKSLNDLANDLNIPALVSLSSKQNNESKTNGHNGNNENNKNVTMPFIVPNENKKFLFDKNTPENTEKLEIHTLFKKQKDLILQNIEIKKKRMQELNAKLKDLNEFSKQYNDDGFFIDRFKNILYDLKTTFIDGSNQINGQQNITNFHLEYNLQQKMMLALLNLASDPTVSSNVQKRRREFYEKTKTNMAKLQNYLQNQKMIKSQPIINEHGSNGLTKLGSFNEKLSETKSLSSSSSSSSNQDQSNFIMMIESNPGSIHRKDSYRRAQEQKLFLESNSNYLNKQNTRSIALNGRKVRTIQSNNHQDLLPLGFFDNTSSKHQQKIVNSNFIDNTPNNLIYPNSNGHSANIKPSYTNNHLDTNEIMLQNNNKVQASKNPKLFYIEPDINTCRNNNTDNIHNHNNIDSESFDDDFNNHHQLILNNQQEDDDFNDRSSDHITTGSLNFNNNNYIGGSDTLPGCGMNNGLGSGVGMGLTKRCSQRKNTSDSNVKLLADHNFYHVTNRRHQNYNNSETSRPNRDYLFKDIPEFINHNYQNVQMIANAAVAAASSTISSNSSRQHQHQQQQHELLIDHLKYNSKYKRGMNSSSNSLISLNSSSIGTNDDSTNINNSDRDIIRSNPDLKSSLVYSPKTILSTSNHNNEQMASIHNRSISNNTNNNIEVNSYYQPPSRKIGAADLSNLSNNLSLNLSIHTAEEFGNEMLAWLNNNNNLNDGVNINPNNTSNNSYNGLKSFTINTKNSNEETNATLV